MEFNQGDDMTIEDLNKLKPIMEKKLKFTDDNISEKLLNFPYLFHEILDIYLKEKRELDKLDRKKKRIYQQKYDHFKFKGNFRLDSAKEIEIYINGDEEYDKICLEYNIQEVVVTYFVELLDMLKKSTFAMQSYIKMREFLAGK